MYETEQVEFAPVTTPEFPPSYGEFRAARERYLDSTRMQTREHLAELAIREAFSDAQKPEGPRPTR